MKVLVTGGAGFIGSHIATRLVAEGHEVVAFDNLTSGKRENLQHLAGKVELVVGDVRDAAALADVSRGCAVAFHQAAIVSVPYSVDHPQETHDVNIQGTLNVLHAAKANGIKRVVFACSAAVYGEEPETPKVETMRPVPVSPYGIEKLTGEHYLDVWNRLYGVETVSLRYFNDFGERQDPRSPYSGVISIFVDHVRRRRPNARLRLRGQRRGRQHACGLHPGHWRQQFQRWLRRSNHPARALGDD
jgi:UDP-glucose 4-epimerase